ncbi:MAG: cell division protein ZapA [Clostridiales bacterium]|jgi:cell division protein ZapA|nr:cell division protein ZapA [Clostridiales bacterium]
MTDKTKHLLEIAGIQITVLSSESREYMEALAEALDKRIKEITEANRRVSRAEAALLAALILLDERLHAELRTSDLNSRFAEYGRVLDDAKRENDELRKLLGR